MIVELIRKEFTEHSTIGDLIIDGEYFCFTLEDVVRDAKIQKETAIPYGKYEVITNYSNRFKRVMPLLLNVPNFEGVRIHNGNTDADTEGCVLIGYTKSVDFIGNSRSAFNSFFNRLKSGLNKGKVFLTISGQIIGA